LYSKDEKELLSRNIVDEESLNKIKEIIPHIRSALDKAPKFEGTVYRGTTVYEPEEKFRERMKKGNTITFDGFMSTSDKESMTKGFSNQVMYKIRSKNGADIRDFNRGESEVLFKDGTQFKVAKYKEKNIPGFGSVYQIELQEV